LRKLGVLELCQIISLLLSSSLAALKELILSIKECNMLSPLLSLPSFSLPPKKLNSLRCNFIFHPEVCINLAQNTEKKLAAIGFPKVLFVPVNSEYGGFLDNFLYYHLILFFIMCFSESFFCRSLRYHQIPGVSIFTICHKQSRSPNIRCLFLNEKERAIRAERAVPNRALKNPN
jgi:hypothetical protein